MTLEHMARLSLTFLFALSVAACGGAPEDGLSPELEATEMEAGADGEAEELGEVEQGLFVKGCVYLYEHSGYRGRRFDYCGKGVANLANYFLWNDAVSSFRVRTPGLYLCGYTHANYRSLLVSDTYMKDMAWPYPSDMMSSFRFSTTGCR